MPDLTEEEYDVLDEYWTENTPKIDTSKPGFVTRRMRAYVVNSLLLYPAKRYNIKGNQYLSTGRIASCRI
jgi:hypothetical protein